MTRGRRRAVVSGMICGDPYQGGATWAVLQYILGLRRLGWDVTFAETIAATAVLPAGSRLSTSVNATYLARVMRAFGLEADWALLLQGSTETVGMSRARLTQACQSSDLLFDLSGRLTHPGLRDGPRLSVYVDLDPGFTQLWHSYEGIDMRFDGHDRFVTVGLAVGTAGCPVPDCGVQWIPTLPPVVLDHWPRCRTVAGAAMTTVSHWRGYGSIEHGGTFYGQKAHSVRELMSLPTLTDQPIVLALAIDPGEHPDLEALAFNGWRTVDPLQVAGNPQDYRAFVQGSRSELGLAKSGYVKSACAWFSDRSACYLASGRPVVAQETGFSQFLPTDAGLLAFTDAREAADAIARVNADYSTHAAAAHRVAVEHLDSDLVLARLISGIEQSA